MKYLIVLFLISFLAHNTKGQDSTIAYSKFEIFTSQAGKLLKTELKEAGNFGPRPVTVFKTTDIMSGISAYAVRLGYMNAVDMPILIYPKALYLDFDELDSVINVLTYFLTETEKPKPTNNLQLSYTTANDIVFFCSYDKIYNSWGFDIGKVYKHLRTYIPGTSITYHNKKRITRLIEELKTAQSITITR